MYERPFNLRPSEVWRSWWNGEQPLLVITLFEVPVDFNLDAPEGLEIVKVEGSFDRDFRGSRPEMKFLEEGEIKSHWGRWKDDGSILFSWPYKPGVIGSIGLRLPYGKYRLTASFAEKEQCEKSTNTSFQSKPDVESEKSSQIISVKQKCS